MTNPQACRPSSRSLGVSAVCRRGVVPLQVGAAVLCLLVFLPPLVAQPSPDRPGSPADAGTSDADQHPPGYDGPLGVIRHELGVAPGYVLYSPLLSTTTYLIDNDGTTVHSWPSEYGPSSVYLLDDGSLLHCARLPEPPFFGGGGIYGRLERIDPDGRIIWSYELASEHSVLHHDVEPLPNGNLLLIAWEHKTPREVLAAGRHPAAVGERGLWPPVVFELHPTPPSGGEVVWEWHAWDHLVQDLDDHLAHFGVVADQPGRFDINGDHRNQRPLSSDEQEQLDELEQQMRALGYVGGNDESEHDRDRRRRPDWMHTNAVDYHAGLDLILLSSAHFDELYVIDHSTTSEQAAGGAGGRWGHGGELLWRWGDPRRYGAADDEAQQLFAQHDPQWLDGSNAGASPGHGGQAVRSQLALTVFNNGVGRPGGDHSSVDELILPFDPERGFLHEAGQPFGPRVPSWSFADPGNLFSPFISSAQRLPNGNTLVCEGISGRCLEVTRDGRVVWEFRNPFSGDVPAPKGTGSVPPLAMFRATRYAPDHPGILALLDR